jgi:hypothetical protein
MQQAVGLTSKLSLTMGVPRSGGCQCVRGREIRDLLSIEPGQCRGCGVKGRAVGVGQVGVPGNGQERPPREAKIPNWLGAPRPLHQRG